MTRIFLISILLFLSINFIHGQTVDQQQLKKELDEILNDLENYYVYLPESGVDFRYNKLCIAYCGSGIAEAADAIDPRE